MSDRADTSSDPPEPGPVQAPPAYPFPETAERLLPWQHAEDRLLQARHYWLATVRPDGRPHVTPLWAVWVDGALYLDGPPTTTWGRNIRRNPRVSVHLESGDDVVILEGQIEDVVTDAATGKEIVRAWDAKYGRLHPQPDTDGILRLRPRTARAWSSESLQDGTRWTFRAPVAGDGATGPPGA